MHPTIYLSLLSLLASPILADTKYGCWSERSPIFHADCLAASTSLILQQIGDNGESWFPADPLYYGYGSCVADIRGIGDGSSVSALNLMSSMDQLGSRCQNGWFFYDSGWINGELRGHAGFKKRNAETPLLPSEYNLRKESLESLRERQRNSKYTWNITENVPYGGNVSRPDWYSPDGKPNDNHPTVKLNKRQPLPWVGEEIFRYDNGDQNTFWRVMRMGVRAIAAPPQDPTFLRRVDDTIFDLMYDAYQAADGSIRNGPTDATVGPIVHALVLTARLGIFFKNNGWRSAIEGIGGLDRAYLVGARAFADWRTLGCNSAFYHIVDRAGNIVFRFVINGVIGNTDPLPSG
ncbi:hypothetical protein TWF694_004664 [Orbilia ellipsospora]|uniref:Uncharacterized protein n=1 Tax=Orbilia ellipsospora TaxID=2528407 RepID=A0AAV9WVU9_9PEZI